MQEQEAEIKFERENLEGIVPVGTYLSDAARRMGIYLEDEPENGIAPEPTVIKIVKGGEFLSSPTKSEWEYFSDARLKNGERLANHARIEKAGEITIMTTEKKQAEKADYEVKKEAYRKEFEDLPLEKKIASLVELEAITLGDTFSFVLNSPSMIVGKFLDVLAEFGWKMDDEAKKKNRPAEHQAPEPSVKETAASQTADEPSVTENTGGGEDAPSVTESQAEENPAPSVEENSANNSWENPAPPSF